MRELLLTLDSTLYYVLVCISVLYFITTKPVTLRQKSLAICMGCIVVFETIGYLAIDRLLNADGPVQLIRMLWFGGFSVLALLIAGMIFKLHHIYKTPPTKLSQLLVGTYSMFPTILVLTYFDYSFWKVDIFVTFYRVAMPAFGILITASALGCVIKEIASNRKLFRKAKSYDY